MNATQAALFGALIGGVAALTGTVITNIVALRNERTRQEAARQASRIEVLRSHAAVAFGESFTVQHAVEWITWYAEHDPEAIDDNMVKSFDDEIHRAYPKMVGAPEVMVWVPTTSSGLLRPGIRVLVEQASRPPRTMRSVLLSC